MANRELYKVTKTYGHNLGLSTTFRQWRATSHCRFLHGYALEVKLVFAAPKLNDNNWVIDFGSLKPVKAWLANNFDHKTLVAEDDPALPLFKQLAGWDDVELGWRDPKKPKEFISTKPIMDLVVVPMVGCEGFAKWIAENVNNILFRPSSFDGNTNPLGLQGGADNGVYLESVEVREHSANSAIYYPDRCVSRVLNKDCEPETGSLARTVQSSEYHTEGDSDGDDGA